MKIFDVSVPGPSRILSGSFKDMLLFPKETTLSWKQCVATKSSDPDRIQTRKFKIPAAFLIDFSPGKPDILKKMCSHWITGSCQDYDQQLPRKVQDSHQVLPRILSGFAGTIRQMSSSLVRLSFTLLKFLKRTRQYFVRWPKAFLYLHYRDLPVMSQDIAKITLNRTEEMRTQRVLNCKPSVHEVNR